jgi:hypothetical protein
MSSNPIVFARPITSNGNPVRFIIMTASLNDLKRLPNGSVVSDVLTFEEADAEAVEVSKVEEARLEES